VTVPSYSWFNEKGVVDPNRDTFDKSRDLHGNTHIYTNGGRNDIMKELQRALAPNATVNLNGCDTAPLAKDLSRALPNRHITAENGPAHRPFTNTTYSFSGSSTYVNGESLLPGPYPYPPGPV